MKNIACFLTCREKFFATILGSVFSLVSLGSILLVFASAQPLPAGEVLVLDPVVISAARAS